MSSVPDRLPRGRHGLSREEVVASQRERMLRALADTTADKGFVGTSVADILRVAGVSRETFYQQFTSKEDCFLSAYDEAVTILLGRMASAPVQDTSDEAAAAEDERIVRLDRVLGSYLEAIAAEPAFARVFLLEVFAVGPVAFARRAAGQERFSAMLAELVGAGDDADARFAAEALVAATSSLVTTRLAVGDLDGIRGLRAPLIRLSARLLPPA